MIAGYDADWQGGRRPVERWISLGVLASWVPRDEVEDAVEAAGKTAKWKGGKLPPQVMEYFVMALALFGDEDYEEVRARLTETLAGRGGFGDDQALVTTGGITQARQRLGHEPVKGTFDLVAAPVATLDTPGALLESWRKMSIDGQEWDVPDSTANATEFGCPGTGDGGRAAFPKARAVTIGECASHAPRLAAIGPCTSKGSGEQSLARELYPRLEEDWLLIADRNFYNWQGWCAASDTGAALLWRVKADLVLEPLEFLTDGSYLSVLVNPKVKGAARQKLTEAARAGEDLDPAKARHVQVIEYEVSDRAGDGKDELIAPVTTITDLRQAPAPCSPRHITRGGNTKRETRSSRPTSAARGKSCARPNLRRALGLLRQVHIHFLLANENCWNCGRGRGASYGE
jgi:hypothetical protein